MPICAAYARYSSEDQRPTSIDDQLRRCREAAERLGLSIDERRVYADAAVTGKESGLKKRLAYQALKRAAADKLFDVLFVDEVSRLGRDMLESNVFAMSLSKLGIRVVTGDGLDTNEPHWRLPWIVKSFTAEHEMEQLVYRIRRGIEGQLHRGFQVGPPPYGYRLAARVGASAKGCRWEIVPAEAEVVREIYRLRCQGRSCNQIALELDRRGVPPRGADREGGSKMWRPTAVHHVVRNTIYRGVFERCGSSSARTKARREGKPLDPQVFDRPEYRIVEDAEWFNANRTTRPTSCGRPRAWGTARRLLSGLVECGDCGSTITIAGAPVSRTMYCPRCYLDHKHGRREDWLRRTSESATMQALHWVLRELMTEDVVAEFRRLLKAAAEAGPGEYIEDCERRLEQATMHESRVRKLLLDPALSDDSELAAGFVRAKNQVRELTAELSRLKAECACVDGDVVDRQLEVDPRELLGPLLAAPSDAAQLNAVLRRLLPRFRFVGRERRFCATFEIGVALGEVIAESVHTPTVVRGTVTYRVDVRTSARRPILWVATGRRIG